MSINNIALENETGKLVKAMTPVLGNGCIDKQDTTMAKDLANIVKNHALGAAAAGLGIAWAPGVGSTAAVAAMTGFIWSMYFRINNRLGLKFSKVAVKSLASAMLSNISQAAISVAGTVAISSLLSLTGVGNVASSAIMAAMDYAIVMVGGIIYLKLLNKLMKAGASPDDMSPEDMKIELDQVMQGENIASLLKEQKKNYKVGKWEGTITGEETMEILE